jgi:hypothetical protein
MNGGGNYICSFLIGALIFAAIIALVIIAILISVYSIYDHRKLKK